MNAEIRRQGIVIRTVPITSDRVRIGSGEQCEIQLTDPFVAPLVAELVRHGQDWRIVDAGVSLSGVTRNGSRVLDERVEPGESYNVGAFELVIDPERAARASREMPRPDGGAIPMTMMSADLGVIPGTVVEMAIPPAGTPQRAPAKGNSKLVFAPVEAPRDTGRSTRAPARTAPTRRRILLVVAVAFATICVGLAVVMSSGGKQAQPAVATNTATATQAATTPPARVDGDELAANLEIEKAFAAWEAEFATKPTTELRDKIVTGAFELARAHAAADDAASASAYFAKVVRYGDPNSDVVRVARARVAN